MYMVGTLLTQWTIMGLGPIKLPIGVPLPLNATEVLNCVMKTAHFSIIIGMNMDR